MINSQVETITVTEYFDSYAVSLKSYQMIRKEVCFLSTLHHENLTQLCGVSTSPFMLLIELAPLGSLYRIIKEYRSADQAFASPVLRKSMAQVSIMCIVTYAVQTEHINRKFVQSLPAKYSHWLVAGSSLDLTDQYLFNQVLLCIF